VDTLKSWQLNRAYPIKLPVAGVKLVNKQFVINPLIKKYIEFGGTFTSAWAFKSANSTPALQNEYAQGQSFGGKPQWRGPETGEMFSYGPSLSSLEYDGIPYAYDPNGKLVDKGTGSGLAANTFDNGILRTGLVQKQLLSFRASKILEYRNIWNIGIKAGLGNEGSIIRYNSNSFNNITANFDATLNQFTFSGAYTAYQSRFSNENRGGFLNRAYQNSLLAPVSFHNKAGALLSPNVQRRYGSESDNPDYLLIDNGHSAKSMQQTANLSAKFRADILTLGLSSTLETTNHQSNEALKAGTAFFDQGFPLAREKKDHRFTIDGYLGLDIDYNQRKLKSTAKLGYNHTQNKSDIAYLPLNNNYNYERSVNEFLLSYQTILDAYDVRAGVTAGNKTYQSSTFTKGVYFLPSIDGFVQFPHLLGRPINSVKLAANYSEFYTEPVPATSYASYSLTQLSPVDAFKFLPYKEAIGFTALRPVKNKEFTTKLEVGEGYPLQFIASYFIRNSQNEVFPVNEMGNIMLKNLANVRFSGFEAEFSYRTRWSRKLMFSQSISFYKWTNKVKSVNVGYNFTPIAGFSTINKALVAGQPLGVLVGNSYLKDQQGRTVIANDGFPIVNNTPTVIGNPIPDFTLKWSQNLIVKQSLTLSMDWEYRKGGDVWNGTQALLDYYGRSASSAVERKVTGYIFEGVTTSGQPNHKPISFYDPTRPLSEAKWLRYGPSGVATDYLQKGDAIRLRNVSLTYRLPLKKIAQNIGFTAYAKELIVWTAYKGGDPEQLLYDQANAQGLDFFNLPSTRTFGLSVSVQF